ncbi:hypothetical protein [Metabacillus malikii]|uniref:Transposase/invertase (TIGR01784 family) n=1 Tax=Metabacillus malikii TaxID=1504265 RepID=A0ABT9ZP24_9BACI|nr:hypothetical protein [Metabacillus malikii]MDQ0233268.1 putative transposase/invertase (TIGR01784 family) [Metabacillus malikii]
MKYTNPWYEKGREQGREEGRIEGMKESIKVVKRIEQINIARKMIEANLEIEQISKFTGLSIEEIKEIMD